MDVSSIDYQRVKHFVDLGCQPGNEFEFRIKERIDRFQFSSVIQRFIQRGFTLAETDVLDIRVETPEFEGFRYHMEDKTQIVRYCKSNVVGDNNGSHNVDRKTAGEAPVDIEEYRLRASLKRESVIDDVNIVDSFIAAIESDAGKHYRYKKRYSLSAPKSSYRLDASVVKTSATHAKTFAQSGVLAAQEMFEVELELVVKKKEGQALDLKTIVHEGFNHVAEVIKAIDGTELIVKRSEAAGVLQQYLALTKQSTNIDEVRKNAKAFFIGPQNVALELRNVVEADVDVISVQHGYSVTDKADGERMLLFVDSKHKVYLINNRLDVRDTGATASATLKNTLIDGEWITRSKLGNVMNKFMAFDVYYHKGESVAHLPLMAPSGVDSRLDVIRGAVAGIKSNSDFVLTVKEFKTAEGAAIFEECAGILNNYKLNKIEYEIDGLIFTPLAGQTNLKDLGSRTFKWKPPQDNTIDFLVDFEDDINITVGSVNRMHKCVNLICGFRSGSDGINPLDILLQKKPADANKYVRRVFAKAFLPIEDDGRILTLKTREPILNGMIVEMSYDMNQEVEMLRWHPKLIRYDKNELLKKTARISGTANDYHVAIKTLRTIKNPVTIDMITGKAAVSKDTIVNMEDVYYNRITDRKSSPLAPMLLFHNSWVKNERLLQLFRKKHYKLFDFGVGKAGDLRKWFDAEYSLVVGADVVADNILSVNDGAYKRYQEKLQELNDMSKRGMRVPSTKALFLVMDAGTRWTKEYVENLSNEHENQHLAKIAFGYGKSSDVQKQLRPFHNVISGFDVASCQFAIHYFFRDRASLSAFAENLNSLLKVGGYFVGTCMDGETVHRKLRDLPSGGKIEGKQGDKTLWMIMREYDDFVAGQSIGKKIKNYIETINKVFDEYLVDMVLLEEVFAQYNIRLLTKHDSDALGLPGSSGMFGDSYEAMKTAYAGDSKKYAYLKNAMEMSPVAKEYSFMNRWFVFRKYAV